MTAIPTTLLQDEDLWVVGRTPAWKESLKRIEEGEEHERELRRLKPEEYKEEPKTQAPKIPAYAVNHAAWRLRRLAFYLDEAGQEMTASYLRGIVEYIVEPLREENE